MAPEERLHRAAERYASAEDDLEYERARILLAKYGQGSAGRVRIQMLIDRICAVVLKKLRKRGQWNGNENVPTHPETSTHGNGGGFPR